MLVVDSIEVRVRMGVHVVTVTVLVPVPVLVRIGRRVPDAAWADLRRGSSRAGGAETHDREVREPGLVSERLPDPVAYGVEVLRQQRSDRAASLAVEVLAVLADAQCVEPGAVAEMDVAQQTRGSRASPGCDTPS